jgi:hypothetical protein
MELELKAECEDNSFIERGGLSSELRERINNKWFSVRCYPEDLASQKDIELLAVNYVISGGCLVTSAAESNIDYKIAYKISRTTFFRQRVNLFKANYSKLVSKEELKSVIMSKLRAEMENYIDGTASSRTAASMALSKIAVEDNEGKNGNQAPNVTINLTSGDQHIEPVVVDV